MRLSRPSSSRPSPHVLWIQIMLTTEITSSTAMRGTRYALGHGLVLFCKHIWAPPETPLVTDSCLLLWLLCWPGETRSRVPTAPWIFFQALGSRLAYPGFSERWDTARPEVRFLQRFEGEKRARWLLEKQHFMKKKELLRRPSVLEHTRLVLRNSRKALVAGVAWGEDED